MPTLVEHPPPRRTPHGRGCIVAFTDRPSWRCGVSTPSRRARLRRCTPLDDRLWRRVDKSGQHWLWTGRVSSTGYGEIGRGRRGEGNVSTHVAAWEVTYGPVPPGMFVCHRCDIRLCCNPDCLFLGTPKDNSQDMIRKGRGVSYRGTAHVMHKITDDEVREIRRRVAASESKVSIARDYGITHQFVDQLWRRVRRSYVEDK